MVDFTKNKPYYVYNEFKEACGGNLLNLEIFEQAEDDADRYFNLFPKPKIFEAVVNGDLENLNFISKKIWQMNPNPKISIYIDSYKFEFLKNKSYVTGYIAFLYHPIKKKWYIKSFKLDDSKSYHHQKKLIRKEKNEFN